MPNYCYNKIMFKGDMDFIRTLLSGKDSNGEQRALTFNTLVPMPEDIFRGPLGFEEMKRLNGKDWYTWCLENWGTKWDAFDVKIDGNTICFTTAWDTPRNWIQALAKALDAHGITAHGSFYIEGGFPNSLSGYCLQDGEVVRDKADEEFAEAYRDEDTEDDE